MTVLVVSHEASLTGALQIDGRAATGTYGLITLEPADGKWKPRTPKRVVIEQRGREFLPHLTAVSVGSTVQFPNYDTVFHNVFSSSPNGAFDLGLYKAGEAREYTFTHEGIVRLACNLHASMSGYVAVVAAPAYVVTDDSGRFAFKHLPPGRYTLLLGVYPAGDPAESARLPVQSSAPVRGGTRLVLGEIAIGQ